jgi:MFS family permease
VTDPYLLVAVQLLDGLTAAVFSVMVPLTVADLTRGTGRFNLTQGVVGTMMGVGASLSPTFAGYVSDTLGSPAAFLGLATIAVIGLATVWLLMPETRPETQPSADSAGADTEPSCSSGLRKRH